MMYVYVRGTDGLIDDWKRKQCIVSSVKQGRWNNFLLEKNMFSIYQNINISLK